MVLKNALCRKFDCHRKNYDEYGPCMVRVLFHNLISPISIYTRRAFWARLSMLHVIEFNLWPISSAPQSIENEVPSSLSVRVLLHNLFSRISIYTRRAFWARLSMLHVMEFNLWPKFSASQSIEKRKMKYRRLYQYNEKCSICNGTMVWKQYRPVFNDRNRPPLHGIRTPCRRVYLLIYKLLRSVSWCVPDTTNSILFTNVCVRVLVKINNVFLVLTYQYLKYLIASQHSV